MILDDARLGEDKRHNTMDWMMSFHAQISG